MMHKLCSFSAVLKKKKKKKVKAYIKFLYAIAENVA